MSKAIPGDDFTPVSIIVLGTPGACGAIGGGLTMLDDDDLGVLGMPTTPHFPDGGQLIFDAFKAAYILPVYLDEYSTVVPFEDYLNAFEIDYGQGSWDDSADLLAYSSSDFWAWFVVGAWEGSDNPVELNRDADGDPDDCFNLLTPPSARQGAESPLFGATDRPDRKSVVFLQAIADDRACVDVTDEVHNVVHEIGHAHSTHDDGGVMAEGAPKNQSQFTGKSMQKFRSTPIW